MFNVGGAELFIILLLALVVLGPDKLPGAMRTVGQWAGEMRKMASGFQSEMNKAMKDPLDVKSSERPAKAGDRPGETTTAADDATTGSTNGASAQGAAAADAGAATGEADADDPPAGA